MTENVEVEVKLPVISLDLVEACKLYGNFFEGRDEEEIKEMVKEYKMFWRLIKKYPKQPFSPTERIDEVWHLHMLHPQNYFADSKGYFNGILSHHAGFGKKDDELPELLRITDVRNEIWEKEYGYKLTRTV
ncbi:glycine-rich domain-containing protein-like [Terribacillus saccharophilus]|uniref:Glycine-rich domain-containing protein-like n=1 Tax=Terribacillus saccharophilus TaxID=361277 RepID=A0A268AAY7_9BACI|nr:glycine-rich domain-containing protein-like [Terribacillus saccharophilus]PAD21298.1 hypothetical protein CHH64_09350 [Terribacillus saccharophilus]